MAFGSAVGAKYSLEPSSANSAALDASGVGTISASTTGTVSLTTGVVNTIILVFVAISSGINISGVSDSQSLAWHKLAAVSNGSSVRGEVWWAFEPTAQGHTITVTMASSATAEIVAGSILGTNTSLPFDPQTLVASIGTGTTASVSSLNTNPADIFIGFVACLSNPTLTVGAGFTTINAGANSTTVSGGAEYNVVTGTPASQAVAYTLGSSHPYVIIGFALMSSGNNFTPAIQASPGTEWAAFNLYSTTNTAILVTDGVNTVLLDTLAASHLWDSNADIRITNTEYVVAVNVSPTNPGVFGFDGVETV